ncbi:DUF397 domain-containing protein [Herbidospora sp. RD11066]
MSIYDADLSGASFRRFCGGYTGDDGEACVEVAAIPGRPGTFAVRDSKNPGAGTLRFTRGELAGFAAEIGTL